MSLYTEARLTYTRRYERMIGNLLLGEAISANELYQFLATHDSLERNAMHIHRGIVKGQLGVLPVGI